MRRIGFFKTTRIPGHSGTQVSSWSSIITWGQNRNGFSKKYIRKCKGIMNQKIEFNLYVAYQ